MLKPKSPRRRKSPIKETQDGVSSRFIAPVKSLPDIKETPKVPKDRHSGHWVEQKFKIHEPIKVEGQLSLFERLSPSVAGEVRKYEIKYDGVKLTPQEDRLVSALYSLLRKNSENKDLNSEKFYKGNYEENLASIRWGETFEKPAALRIVPAELYKAYLGNENYSGKEIEDINRTLKALEAKRFLITYDRTRKIRTERNTTENRTDRIETTMPLIQVMKYTRDLTDHEKARLDRGEMSGRKDRGELIIALNPILTDQIQSKYVEYPSDINLRTVIAAGGHPKMVTQAINNLRDWLFFMRSNKLGEVQLNADKLPRLLKLDNYVQQGRKKLVRARIEEAIQACKNLRLILDVKETYGAEGQLKYIFILNPDFE